VTVTAGKRAFVTAWLALVDAWFNVAGMCIFATLFIIRNPHGRHRQSPCSPTLPPVRLCDQPGVARHATPVCERAEM